MLIEYVDKLGTDLTVVNAARVSFQKHKLSFDERDKKLLEYMATEDHWSPFAHIALQCRVTVPIAIARQMFKTTVGIVYNEASGRYTTKEVIAYVPSELRNQKGKQGSEGTHPKSEFWRELYEENCFAMIRLYHDMVADGVAVEQARFVLPQAEYTMYYATGSVAAWARIYHLRTGEHAQKEWGLLTPTIDSICREHWPHAWAALVA